jgi:hypothetical protein
MAATHHAYTSTILTSAKRNPGRAAQRCRIDGTITEVALPSTLVQKRCWCKLRGRYAGPQNAGCQARLSLQIVQTSQPFSFPSALCEVWQAKYTGGEGAPRLKECPAFVHNTARRADPLDRLHTTCRHSLSHRRRPRSSLLASRRFQTARQQQQATPPLGRMRSSVSGIQSESTWDLLSRRGRR